MRYIYKDVEYKDFYCEEVGKTVNVTLTVAVVPESEEVVSLQKVDCNTGCSLCKIKKCVAFSK